MVGERLRKLERIRTLEQMTFRQSQVIGWMQCLALIPGVSRSGATISAALFQGFDRESAARFAFLLSIPPLAAAGIYEFYKDVIKSGSGVQIAPMLIGMVVAAVSAYLVIDWFLRIVKRHGTAPFIVYRIVVGLALIGLLQAGILKDSRTTAQREERTVASAGQGPSRPRLTQRERYSSSGGPGRSDTPNLLMEVQEGRKR
jgi:undecaprenyl-diphosphatase